MKIKTILLAIASLLFCANIYAQNITIKGNMPLSQVLKQIEKQSSYLFVYDKNEISAGQTVNVNISNVPVETALNDLFSGLGIAWKIKGDNIVLTPVTKETKSSGASFTMTGVVSDDTGEPIVGAVVQKLGTNDVSITDIDGNFSLAGLTKSDIIKVSCLGFKEKEFTAENTKALKIVLVTDSEMLKDVIVIGYGSLEKSDVTSSITSISASDMMKGVGGSDFAKSLQGMVSGLVISQTKSVNAGSSMQLRGMASIVAGTEPLIVIDGFPGGDIGSINPDDIKSIEVLKDASAGAIYGTRAAAGVILVTTKSGYDTEGKLNVSYAADFSHKQAYRQPAVLSADEYRSYGVGKDYGSSTDWWNESINKGNFSHKHNLTINYGSNKLKLYSSLFYEKQDGLPKGENREDIGARINASYMMFDGWFEMKTNVDFRQSKKNFSSPSFGQALLNNPTRSPYDTNSKTGYNIWTGEVNDYNSIADAALVDNYGTNRWIKPELILKLNILPVKGLDYQQTLGYSYSGWEGNYYRSINHRLSLENSVNGYAAIENSKNEDLNAEGYFTYDNTLGGKHKINATLGYSYFQHDSEYTQMSNSDFSVDGIKVWDIGKGSYLSQGLAGMSSHKYITEKLLAFFVRGNYTYDGRYIISGTYRREGSSKFGPKNRWGNFWAVSAGWNLKNERWLQNVRWLTDLKLRAGYGVTGNNSFNAAYSGKFIGADENKWIMPDGAWRYTYGREENVNEELGWESKAELNVGLDYSFFDGRLYGKFDVYYRKITDMLFYVRVPVGTYINSYQWQNVGSMENKGWEFEIGGDIFRTPVFTWRSNLNLSHSDSRILTMDNTGTKWDGGLLPGPNSPGTSIILTSGSHIGEYYIYEFAGFNKAGEFLINDRKGNVIPASSKIADDRKLMGNFVPKVMLGWVNNFNWKNWDLSINMHSWIGFDVFNTYAMTLGIAKRNGELNTLKTAYSTFSHIKGEKVMCNYYLEDGSFLKIDAITLGYNLPLAKYTNNILQKFRAYFTLANPFIITRYTGNDPEVSITGYSGGIDDYSQAYPNYRTFTLGLQLNF